MQSIEKKFEPIAEETRKKMVQEFVAETIDRYRKEELKPGIYKYEVLLQEIKFVTGMTDYEVERCAELAIDVIEEMKKINNNGMDKVKFGKLVADVEAEVENEYTRTEKIFDRIRTAEMMELIFTIDAARRVGGLYAWFISNPNLVRTIYVVYEQLVDRFDDEEMYDTGAYFMMRAIMRMRSAEE